MDALTTAANVRDAYLRYLRTLLPVRDARIGDALDSALAQDDALVRTPILEATPPFVAGASLRQLIDEGILPKAMTAIDTPGGIPLERPLHAHQEQAVRHAGTGRNMVVATGTGSGKTESFFLPILADLLNEGAGLATPGVRALLLYPMNALANDQMKRLRTLLEGFPDITFGRYIGDTRHEKKTAEEVFSQQFPGATAPDNELLSREEMQATPPHLLITNYAMLEYLLLRPADNALFDANPDSWKTVVLDEAHVYDGAAGIEVGMLLRRLRDRVARTRDMRFILTSATVGGREAGPAVASFATHLTGADFTYDEARGPKDVLWAQRQPVDVHNTWGPLDPDDYGRLAGEEDTNGAVLAAAAQHAGGVDAAEALAGEARMSHLRALLAAEPRPVEQLAEAVFPDDDRALDHLRDLVRLGAAVTSDSGTPLLSARYHHWLRATEGAFVCLDLSGPHVWLTRHETCRTCDGVCAELGACRRCNATYLTGSVRTTDKRSYLTPRHSKDEQPRWFVLTEARQLQGIIDEDDEVLEGLSGAVGDFTPIWWCTRCGRLHDAALTRCECGSDSFRHLLEAPKRGLRLLSCGLCGGRSNSGQVRLFESGRDAAVAVIGTELYQSLPPQEGITHPGAGRKMLLFADSRQDAAYFAPYMESSYQQLVWRRALLLGMHDAGELGFPVSLGEVARGAAKVMNREQFFDYKAENSDKLRMAYEHLLSEIIPVVTATSLEGLGLVAVQMKTNPVWAPPAGLLQLGMDEETAWAFVFELLRTLRDQGALSMPDGVDSQADAFEPRKGPIVVREQGPDAKRKILSWVPGRGVNRRLSYIRKVLTELGKDTEQAPQILSGLWRWLTSGEIELLAGRHDQIEGPVQQLNHELLRLRPVTTEDPVWRCGTCQRVAAHSVLDICTTSGCDGRLSTWAPPRPEADGNHYRALASNLRPIPLRVMEHTAQWAPTEAARIQQQFIDGKVNALSCSTTFELGVDVGELESVMLRNVPPRTANYVQRAGRAGRRASSAALVLTYAQKRSHDLTFFSAPSRMISGEVQPPHVRITNPRIAERHAYSVAIAHFLRVDAESHDTPRTVGAFFITDDGGDTPASRLAAMLKSPPAELVEAVARVIPDDLHTAVGVADANWARSMGDLLELNRLRLQTELDEYSTLEAEAAEAGRYPQAGAYRRVAHTIRSRSLLNALGSRNLLPKYGFPVDSVELQTGHVPNNAATKLSLDRDLGMAISDYAPGNEMVAGGYVWKSGGVVQMPGRELEQRHFAACRCGWYEERIGTFAVETCPGCGATGKAAPSVKQYVVPEFGFMAERTAKPKRPMGRPLRTYAGETFLAEPLQATDVTTLELPGGSLDVFTEERRTLVVLNRGHRGGGFLICDWCGWGSRFQGTFPTSHEKPRTGEQCNGHLRTTSLGHRFQTDVLVLRLPGRLGRATTDVWWSVLYAIIEAASTELEISRDDLDGTLQVGDGTPSLVLFDNVPGGAGHVSRVSAALPQVIEAAQRRVANCECGRETSCYRCLRGFRNQWRHDELRRGPVADLLEQLLGPGEAADIRWADPAGQSLQQLEGRRVRATHDGQEIEGTLWVEAEDDEILALLIESDRGVISGARDDFAIDAVAS